MKFLYVFLLSSTLIAVGGKPPTKLYRCIIMQQALFQTSFEEAKRICQHGSHHHFASREMPGEMSREIINVAHCVSKKMSREIINVAPKSMWMRIAHYLKRKDIGDDLEFLFGD